MLIYYFLLFIIIYYCLLFVITAQSYVSMHMGATVACASMMMDWTHEKTADSDDIQ